MSADMICKVLIEIHYVDELYSDENDTTRSTHISSVSLRLDAGPPVAINNS